MITLPSVKYGRQIEDADLIDHDVDTAKRGCFSSHGCYKRVERQAVLLETHVRIARSCHPFLVLISLLILRLHILY